MLRDAYVCDNGGVLVTEGFEGPWHNEISEVALSTGATGTLVYEIGRDLPLQAGNIVLDQADAQYGVNTITVVFSAEGQHMHLYQRAGARSELRHVDLQPGLSSAVGRGDLRWCPCYFRDLSSTLNGWPATSMRSTSPTCGGRSPPAPRSSRSPTATFRAQSSSISTRSCPIRPVLGADIRVPPLDVFRRNIADLGLGRRPVVCYDDTSGATAARMWWMLDAIGHTVAVLDGGIGAWTGPLERGDLAHSEPAVSDPTAIGDPIIVDWPPGRMIEVDEVLARIRDGSVLLDARSAERFRGEPNPVDPVLGHIPGGRSRPWTDNISDDGVFRAADQLRRELTEFGVGEPGEWLASCGSGVTACHNLLAARIAGLGDGRLYAGSWSEWIGDPSRPVATGPAESGQTAR